MNTKQLGLMGELKAQYDFIKAGFDVCVPQGDYSSYDFIAIKEDKILKIQVKTCQNRQDNTKIVFNLKSSNYHTNKIYSKRDCDYFYLFDIRTEQGFLLKNNEKENTNAVTFRITPPNNGAVKGIKFAEDYKFEKLVSILQW